MLSISALAQITGDVIGVHDLSPGGISPGRDPGQGLARIAMFLTPAMAIWHPCGTKCCAHGFLHSVRERDQSLQGNTQMPLGSDSGLCLSCHDGTVAAGDTVLFGKMSMTQGVNSTDQFGTNRRVHILLAW